MGHGKMLTHTRYGERLRKLRRWTHDAFMSKQTLQTYVEVQLRETYILLAGLLESPDEFVSHFTRYAIAAVALFGSLFTLTQLWTGSLQPPSLRLLTGILSHPLTTNTSNMQIKQHQKPSKLGGNGTSSVPMRHN